MPVSSKKGQLPIPQPPPIRFVGNLFDVDLQHLMLSITRLSKNYGPIFKLALGPKEVIFIGSQQLANELCDETKFQKSLSTVLREVRAFSGDGLFTANTSEPNWKLAHNILVPAFGPMNIKNMFADMVDIANQLILKWERFGPEYYIDVPMDFTRLTLDTIALCSFSYRFNSFYDAKMHPFVDAMVSCLQESGLRANRLPVQNSIMLRSGIKYQNDIKYMNDLCDDIISERQQQKDDSNKDLLNLMLNGKDRETGESLSAENIRYQLLTFLIAGHETTSGMLSFLFYYLLKNPTAMQKAQEEVDSVTKGEAVTLAHLDSFKYIDASLKETLRLQPTAPAFSVRPIEKTYKLSSGHELADSDFIFAFLPVLHRDPKVWGEDAEEFKPERMLNGGFEKLPPNSWKPFGNGMRGCIGRGFAWQESLIVVGMLLQRFNFEMADTSYELRIKQTLTIKPDEFQMRARVRKTSRTTEGATGSNERTTTVKKSSPIEKPALPRVVKRSTNHLADVSEKKNLAIFYGSNSGSCESFADKVAAGAESNGFVASVGTLDSVTEALPTDRPVIIITPSYEGQPPENAKRFFAWLTSKATTTKLEKVSYAVFGAGHRDWTTSYQRVPTTIDEKLAERGAKRILPRGLTDAAGNFLGEFEKWEDELWVALKRLYNIPSEDFKGSIENASSLGLSVEMVSENRASQLGQLGIGAGIVKSNSALTPATLKHGGPEKRHVEITLPEGTSYRAGDYLALMPVNPISTTRRVLSRFNLTPDASIVIQSRTKTFLPLNVPVVVQVILSGYVEIDDPVSQRTIEQLATTASDEVSAKLRKLADPAVYEAEVLEKRTSLIDLLEDHPDHQITFAQYLSLLQPMRLRQYSISSSPLWNASAVTLTFDVLRGPALSGRGMKIGVASNYLAQLEKGDRVSCAIKSSSAAFHLPNDPTIPIIMVASGSGISPMRGFIQERAMMAAGGRQLGQAILYYGCRDPEEYVHREELEKWAALGAVTLKPIFSRQPAAPDAPKYPQDAIWEDRATLTDLYMTKNARVYVCGSVNRLAKGVAETMIKITMEAKNVTRDEAVVLFEKQKGLRYATDVFG